MFTVVRYDAFLLAFSVPPPPTRPETRARFQCVYHIFLGPCATPGSTSRSAGRPRRHRVHHALARCVRFIQPSRLRARRCEHTLGLSSSGEAVGWDWVGARRSRSALNHTDNARRFKFPKKSGYFSATRPSAIAPPQHLCQGAAHRGVGRRRDFCGR